jgi:polyisoprenoid-binding protein YceI
MALEKWDLDPAHSEIGFVARHMVITKVRGHFTKWSGSLELDWENPSASKVNASIDAASIDTHEEKRDAHLRSADFLDVEHHKTIDFKGTKIEKAGDNYKLSGDLTIRGTTKPVTLDVEMTGRGKDPWGGERIGFTAKTRINRLDWDLKWNVVLEAGGVLVSENIDLVLEIQAKKA